MFSLKVRPAYWFALLVVALVVVTEAATKRSSAFEQLDLLVDIRHEILSEYVEEPDQEKMVQNAARAMVEALDDPYTVYLSPEELEPFDREIRGTFSGIGAEVRFDAEERRIRVVSPLEDSPAWHAGVLAGDLILEIDSQTTLDMTIDEAIDHLTGAQGTVVVVKVRHESGEEATITITRAVINVPTVKGLRRTADQQWDFMLDHAHGIGYVRIQQFTEKTAGDLRTALERVREQGVKGLILDLRFDPGGLLESAVEVSDLFLPAGKTIVSIRGRTTQPRVFTSTDDDLLTDIPLVVLANEASASAAEIVTGALADNQRAQFIGSRTFGKGSVQQIKPISSGEGAIKITNAYYYLPNGRNIHRRADAEEWGVDPQDGFYVPMTPLEVKAMIEKRREGDILRQRAGEEGDAAMSPQWIEENLKDLQLAAAVSALEGKIQSGDWPEVGKSGAIALAQQSQRESLTRQRDLLQQRMDQIREQLDKLDAGEIVATTAPSADLAADEEMEDQSPTRPAAGEAKVPATRPGPATEPVK
ncbi:MAG: S41 family peptidase [Phycisphaeraceae bacterium]|nr:S41 family peptidase [Phycisphaeraceae bacterium]